MRDLQIDVSAVTPWFAAERTGPYVLIRVSDDDAGTWPEALSIPCRQCYIDDAKLDAEARRTGESESTILAAHLPDRGSTMAGDFGEILVFLYQAATTKSSKVIGPKKWRLKQDRKKPAPYSDVVQFVLPRWPQPSTEDQILCSEVKTKSTAGSSSPIIAAMADCKKDRTSRLAKTLVWLKERALGEDLGTTTIKHLNRFIHATDHPEAKKRFRAVAVVCASLVDEELAADAPDEQPSDHTVVVLAVPNLKQRYEEVFEAAQATVETAGGGA